VTRLGAYATMIRSLCYFLVTRLGAYAPRLGAYATGLGVYATWAIPRGSFDPNNWPCLSRIPQPQASQARD